MDDVPVFFTLKERWNSLAKGQRISAGILGICGLIAFVFSVQRIRAGILDPFTVSQATIQSAKKAVDAIDPGKRLEAEAKRRDTDGDGISDWDEERMFGTSPYLRDTDGDALADNVEIASGGNPNCPSSKVCAAPKLDVSSLVSSSSYPFFGGDLTTENTGNTLLADFQRGMNQTRSDIVKTTNASSTYLEPTLVRDAREIRKVLKESGQVEASVLDQISDEQLLQLYDQAIAQQAEKQLQATSTDLAPPPVLSGATSNL